MTDGPGPGRREQLEASLASVRARVARACRSAGRPADGVTLIAVTKFFPASDILLLAGLGVRDVGENRDQEARDKLSDPALVGLGLTAHFIGQLQTNKCASVVQYADVIHSVDRLKLVHALQRAADGSGRSPRLLIQVGIEKSASRGGASPELVADLADAISEASALRLAGVMAVAPLGEDPDSAFARLHEVAAGVRERYPSASWVSAGMSGDLEAGIRHGATHLRVGSAILGSRPAVR